MTTPEAARSGRMSWQQRRELLRANIANAIGSRTIRYADAIEIAGRLVDNTALWNALADHGDPDALTPIAPEVPPRRDGLREVVTATGEHRVIEVPTHPCPDCGDVHADLDYLSRADVRLAATRTPEPPDSGDGAAQRDREFETMWAFATRWTLRETLASLIRQYHAEGTVSGDEAHGGAHGRGAHSTCTNRWCVRAARALDADRAAR